MRTVVEVDDGGTGSPPAVIRVAVVEDHTMVAQGLQAMLAEEHDVAVVGVVGTVADAVDLLSTVPVDVVLADFRLPDGDGAELAAALATTVPGARVVILTAAEGRGVVARAVAAGAVGFVHKSDPIDEVVAAIRAAAAGDAWFRPALLADAMSELREERTAIGRDLTAREREVLGLLATGASTQELVERLVLSPHTVRNHVRNVMTKLGAHSKLEAVTIAASAGLVQLDRSS